MTEKTSTCKAPCAPPCDREVVADDLCMGHYQRRRREQPINTPLGRVAMVKLPGFRVSGELAEDLKEAATEDQVTMNDLGREALEQWNVRRHKKRR